MMEFMLKKYHAHSTAQGDGTKSLFSPAAAKEGVFLELNTSILGSYCRLETQKDIEEQERLNGKFVREHQLVSASACTSFKASMYVREALSGKNVKLLDKSKLIKDEKTGEIRISELTPLMVACMMSNIQTARILVE
jgi:hypothetical protein